MALNLEKFKEDLKAALKTAQAKNQKDNVEIDTALGNLADEIAAQVDAYIKTMTITIPIGAIVTTQTTASPSPQANANPVVVSGGIS